MNLTVARVVGFFSLPSASLAEANPSAYTQAWANAPTGAGSCAHCGTGILHHVIVECEGQRAFIGTQCAERIGGEVARCVSSGLTSAQQAERDAKHGDESARLQASIAVRETELASRAVVLAPLGDALKDGRNGFCDSVGADLSRGILPSGRGLTLALEILAKRAGRGGSKAYYAELYRLETIIAPFVS